MANTYSSWEYSQGPHLYIDSSGFESIDDKKNFVYYYEVTYSPVEYRRKVTTDKGSSYYEYKYSFGKNNASRNLLGRYTFSGKDKVTKTVEHAVSEDGFYKTISKTFIIDTNISSNINTNTQITVNPSSTVQIINWKFDTTSSVTIPSEFNNKPCGWVTVTKTGYRTESYTSYSSYSYWSGTGANILDHPSTWSSSSRSSSGARTSIGYYDGAIKQYETTDYTYWKYKGDTYRSENDGGNVYKKSYTSYSYTSYRTVPYTYTESYNSYGQLSIADVRKKIERYPDFSSIVLRFRTNTALNTPPKISIDSSATATGNRKVLSCKQAGHIPGGTMIEYYLPVSYVREVFKNYSNIFVLIDRSNCSPSNAAFYDSYAYIETDINKIPYINLLVQAYNKQSKTWSTCCKIPYLNHKEIEQLRDNQRHISKNLFLPSNLPKSDANYRIILDTNLIQREAERLTNFRIDVLSNQLIKSGSIVDKKLYLSNDSLTFQNEVEMGEVDEMKLNVLGYSNFKKKAYAGFLKQGANDVHAYLKNVVIGIDDSIPEVNRSKNIWYGYVSNTNGDWVSNNLFVANTFNIENIGIFEKNNTALQDELIIFKVAYNRLKPNSTYTFKFEAVIDQSFEMTTAPTVNEGDVEKISETRLFSEGIYDRKKIASMKNINEIVYRPIYKIKHDSWTEIINEYNRCNEVIPMELSFTTANIDPNDTNVMTIKIKRAIASNVIIKNMRIECIDKNNEKFMDVIEPYNIDIHTGREKDTHMTIYYNGFNFEYINPMLYKDMVYLRNGLDKIRADYGLDPYPWSEWTNSYDNKGDLIRDENGHGLGVEMDQPLRAVHFNDVKACCVKTYEDLLALKPPVDLNTSPSQMRDNTGLVLFDETDPSKGFILQHVVDREGNQMEVDKYFPEWRQIIELINRN